LFSQSSYAKNNMLPKILYSLGLIMITTTTSSLADTKKLPLCPNSPNCVSSQAAGNDSHFIAPFKIKGDIRQACNAVKDALNKQPRTVVTEETEDSLKAEATSLIFRFVDDVEVVLDEQQGLLHIRSASRIGYGDFGVNRKRVEQLRTELQQQNVIE
jgi:uncharacterized protein (DUF1499 family)